jgi:hydroxymethylpyrimidine/phosphomethylpyrimidine kinase
MIARILTIAGSDSGGGAGIEADIKTIAALGGYACTTITAVTAQNTRGVTGVQVMPADFVTLSIRTVLEDIGVDAIKLGMLANADIIRAVAATIRSDKPMVLDPVMVATSGAVLLPDDAISALQDHLIPLASIITPNLAEAAKLTGLSLNDEADYIAAGQKLRAAGAKTALIKGGHGEGDTLTDFLIHEGGVDSISLPRIDTTNTHGTGCTLASAIATGLGQGMTLFDSVSRARHYLQTAIAQAPGFGSGYGPVWHGHR